MKLGLDAVPLSGTRDEAETFYFVVNDVPIYAKGTNVVPIHVMPTDTTDADIEQLVLDISRANMNMIRVWGGGGFQPDYFYQLCDEYGIMVMQVGVYVQGKLRGRFVELEAVVKVQEDAA